MTDRKDRRDRTDRTERTDRRDRTDRTDSKDKRQDRQDRQHRQDRQDRQYRQDRQTQSGYVGSLHTILVLHVKNFTTRQLKPAIVQLWPESEVTQPLSLFSEADRHLGLRGRAALGGRCRRSTCEMVAPPAACSLPPTHCVEPAVWPGPPSDQ